MLFLNFDLKTQNSTLSGLLTCWVWWFECLAIGSGTIRRCVFIEGGMALLEGVCHYVGEL